MNKKIILIVLLFFVVIFLTAFKMRESISDNSQFLYPEFTWQEKVASDNSGITHLMVVKNGASELIPLSGRVYSTTLTSDNASNLFSQLDNFRKFTNEKTETEGWSQSVKLGNSEYMPTFADGPDGSLYGFVKSSGNNILLFQVEEGWKGRQEKSPEGAIQCPCVYEVRVFLSDPWEVE